MFFRGNQYVEGLYESGRGPSPHVVGRPCVVRLTMRKVVLHWTDDVTDPQHAVSLDALRRLEGFEDARGRPLKVRHLKPFETQVEVIVSLGLEWNHAIRTHDMRPWC